MLSESNQSSKTSVMHETYLATKPESGVYNKITKKAVETII